MTRQSSRVHAFDLDSIQAHTNARRVQTNLANQACFGDHLNGRLVRLLDCEKNKIPFLFLLPIPILCQEACIVRQPRQGCTTITKQPECYLCPDIARDNIREIDIGSVGNTLTTSVYRRASQGAKADLSFHPGIVATFD